LSSEADELRAFRDRALMVSWPGRWVVRGYYASSPLLVSAMSGHPRLTRLARSVLDGVRWWIRRVGGLPWRA